MAFLLVVHHPSQNNNMLKVYCEYCGSRNYCYFETKKLCNNCGKKLPELYYYFFESVTSRLNYHLNCNRLPF